ncbi:glucans biosynthesis glucosyltransferase MdoH [Ponticaulis profundi]|uniref:Glucans biosynthesis glucosyltransferase H n=1 Tax=Ponticaulis profundi TaxID=2665222 RepID=A0ABW1SFM1_9PROT
MTQTMRPREAPLDMRPQSLKEPKKPGTPKTPSRLWRKTFVAICTLLLAGWLTHLMYNVLKVTGMTSLEWLLLVLFVANIFWISFAFVSATIGFLVSLRRNFQKSEPLDGTALTTKTVILFPVYNESVEHVFATIEATSKALAKAAPGKFECFVLSDTTNPAVALEEEAGFEILRQRTSKNCEVFYRRRTINVARKSGNVEDFVTRWGGRYDHMIVYDADSYMSPETLITLVTRMEGDPESGLIQTVPKLIGGKTLFARAQQFASEIYGPVLGTGISWWSQCEGNYWGHNAIIRLSAFASAAGLPKLKGAPPFGGHILSHDFVEAALLRRAGWKVIIAADLHGSYEEGPQTIIDLTIRDRRWCQGNLQHIPVLFGTSGLAPTSRLHLTIGIMSYLASPLWLLLILVGMALSLQNRFLRPEYFDGNTPSLVPHWPVIDPALALTVFGLTISILLLPKLYGLLSALTKIDWAEPKKGISLIGQSLGEVLISALVAPILMWSQTSAVSAIISGRDTGWSPQQRGDEGYAIKDVARQHMSTTILGIVLSLAALAISPIFAAWLAPATLGMVFSIPLSYYLGKSIRKDVIESDFEIYLSALGRRAHYANIPVSNAKDVLLSKALQTKRLAYIDDVWPLEGLEVHIPLATAEARLQRAGDVDTFTSALSRNELMAVMNSPRVSSRIQKQFGETSTANVAEKDAATTESSDKAAQEN